MILYAIQRFTLSVLIVVVAVSVLNIMLHVVPGDPAVMVLGPRATPELIEETRVAMGLDRPLPIQLLTFFGNVLQGDLGQDVFTRRSVARIVFEQLPYTLVLIAVSILWAALLGIVLGCYSAIRRNSWIDKFAGVLSVGTISIPAFVMALYGVLVFAVWLRWLPAIGAGEGLAGVAHLFSAAVFVEVIFARPGIGALIVSAVNERNYPIVLGAVLVTTVIIVLATLVSDLIVAWLDPRLRETL